MTVVNDVDYIFKNTRSKDIFSDKVVEALLDFPFYLSSIFYTSLLITSYMIFGIIYGQYKDK